MCQGSIEVLASLRLLVLGLPRMKAMVDNAKLILDLSEVGFDRLLKLAKSCGREWVRLKPKANPRTLNLTLLLTLKTLNITLKTPPKTLPLVMELSLARMG